MHFSRCRSPSLAPYSIWCGHRGIGLRSQFLRSHWKPTAQSDNHDCTQSIGLVVRLCWSSTTVNNQLACSGLVSVVPCSTRNEANSNLLLMFFSLSFIFKLLATLLLFYILVIPLTNSILYSLCARSTPSMPYTFSGAFLVFAILKLHEMLNLSSCGNAYI